MAQFGHKYSHTGNDVIMCKKTIPGKAGSSIYIHVLYYPFLGLLTGSQ